MSIYIEIKKKHFFLLDKIHLPIDEFKSQNEKLKGLSGEVLLDASK